MSETNRDQGQGSAEAAGPAELRERLVASLVGRGLLGSAAIQEAFRKVPRHLFLPHVPIEAAYRDEHITLKESVGRRLSTSTAPWLMAGMLEQLRPRPGQRLLEIGAGTGYNAAILSELVGEAGTVLTLDVDPEVAAAAEEGLRRAGFVPGRRHPRVLCADGLAGHEKGAPWDGILVTVRTSQIPHAWIHQLAPGGRLVVPLALRGVRHGQLSIAFEAHGESLRSVSLIDCGFIRPRGELSMHDRELELSPEQRGLLWSDSGTSPLRGVEILAMLEGGGQRRATGLELTLRELAEDFQPFMVAHEPNTCSLFCRGPWADWPSVLPMAARPGLFRGTGGVLDDSGFALLGFESLPKAQHPRPLSIVSYGFGDSTRRLEAHLRRWHRAGRPGRRNMQIQLFPPGHAPAKVPAPGVVVRELWGDLLIQWV